MNRTIVFCRFRCPERRVCRLVAVVVMCLGCFAGYAAELLPVLSWPFSEKERSFCRQNTIPDSAWESLRLWEHWRLQVDKTSLNAFPLRSENENGALRIVTADSDAVIYANQVKADAIAEGGYAVRAEFRPNASGLLRLGYYGYDADGNYRGKRETVLKLQPGPMREEIVVVAPEDIPFYPQIRPCFAVGGDVSLRSVSTVGIEGDEPGISVAQGVVREVSLPAQLTPENAPYPDCMLTARVEIVSIQKGRSIPREILLVYPWFLERRPTRYAGLKRGDRLLMRLRPLDEADSRFKSVQQADTIGNYELEPYLATGMAELRQPLDWTNPVAFKDEEKHVSIYSRRVNPALSEDAMQRRKQAIRAEWNLVNTRLEWISRLNAARINQEFRSAWLERQRQLETIDGRIAWGRVENSYFALPLDYKLQLSFNPDPGQIDALRSINEFLLANGVEFIVQLIPYYYDVAARVFNPDYAGIPDVRMLTVARSLLESDIETMYTFDAFVQSPLQKELLFLYPEDAHPGDGAQELLTDMMAERLSRFQLRTDDVAAQDFSGKPGRCRYNWNIWPEGVDIGKHKPGGMMEVEHILYRNLPLSFPEESPVFVVGNSFIQSPMAEGAYSTRLAAKIGRIPSNWYVTSLGPQMTIFPAFARNPEFFLRDRKVVVLPLGIQQLYDFPNLRQYDRIRRLVAESLQQDQVAFDLLSGIPELPEASVEWKNFIENHSARPVLVRAEASEAFCDIQLEQPAKALLVRLCAYPRHRLSMVVNGQEQEVPASETASHFSELLFELPEGTENLHIELKTKQPAAYAGIQDITLLR